MYCMTITYRGTAYHGFQVQQNAVTVCQVFQDAVEETFGRRYPVKGCSRTDSGVHANRFAITLAAPETIPCDAVVRALNTRLPADIAVLECSTVPEDFHPRYNCLGKRYLYKSWNSRVKNPFLQDLAYHVKQPLDVKLAAEAAAMFVGNHDFSAFCAAGSDVVDRVRTVYHCDVTAKGTLLTLEIIGNGFLYNMVRIIAGTVVECASGQRSPGEIPEILESLDRGRAGITLPPHGLYLDEVFYSDKALTAACPQWKEVVAGG